MEGGSKNEKCQESIAHHKTIELKGNHLPKGLVPLERMFNNHDVLVKPMMQLNDEIIVNINIGTEGNSKFVKISKSLTEEHRNKYLKLMKEFVDVFSYSYEDLKIYDQIFFEHSISLKPGTKPFK